MLARNGRTVLLDGLARVSRGCEREEKGNLELRPPRCAGIRRWRVLAMGVTR